MMKRQFRYSSNLLGHVSLQRLGCCLVLTFVLISYTSSGQCPSFAVTPTSSITCNGLSTVFTATGGTNYRWYKDGPLVPGNLQSSGTSTFTPSVSGSYYLVGNACSTNDIVRPFSIVISNTPAVPTAAGVHIPYNSSVVLRPTTNLESGESFKWYASNQTTLLNEGAEYYTGNLIANTTYYVSKTNGYCESAKTAFSVTVNALPVASAGPDVSITLPMASQTLSGSGSDGGNSVSFQWTKLSGPSVTMSGATSPSLTLTNITTGIYVFRLAVTDNFGQKVVDDVIVQANSTTPTNNYNYTRQEIMMISGITNQSAASSLVVGQKSSSTSYLDELGKTMETIGWQASPEKFDLISPVVYDDLGRQAKQYLPEVSSMVGDGLYKKVLNTNGEYAGGIIQNLYGSNKPYAVTVFDNSPLSRTVEQGSTGLGWQPGSSSGTTMLTYGVNTASDAIRVWTINNGTVPTGLPQSSTTWAANKLATSTSTVNVSASRQTTTQLFSDAQQLKLVERVKVDATNWAETHYVYDTRNNLRFIIPPQLYQVLKTAGNYNITLDQVNRYCFQYVYDEQHRVVATKSPGADWEYAVYDIRSHVVLTQNGNQRAKNEWSYVEYDVFDRPTVSGIYRPQSSNSTREYFQSVYDGAVSLPATTSTVLTGTTIVRNTKGSYQEYIASSSITLQPGFVATGSTGPFKAWIYSLLQPGQVLTSGTTEPLLYTYYDSYSGNSFFQEANFAFVNQTWDAPPVTDPLHVPDAYPTNQFTRVIGKVTGRSVKVMGTNQWLNTVTYYDQSQRPIQSVASIHTGGVSRTSTLYDFTGKALQSKRSELGQTTTSLFKYDHAGRVMRVYHKLNNQPQVILAAFEYDQLGRVIDKKLYSTDIAATTPSYLQSVDFRYNIKGWITGLNASGSTGETDYFGYELSYDTDDFGAGISGSVRKDGIPAAVKWRNDLTTKQNLYVYDYDNLSRFTGATFKAGNTSSWTNKVDFYSEKGLSYDYNGNIQTLQRNKQNSISTFQQIDNLSYGYSTSQGNQLMMVTEGSASTLKDLGFKDGNTVGDDYAYDLNGNMTLDKNKGITEILYNFMNLPERVTFSDGSYMRYVYDATETKLSQTYFNNVGQPLVKTDYLGEQLLVNDLPVVIFHEEGRLLPPDNTNRILNREAGSTEGYTANLSVTLSAVHQNNQTYVKVVSNQASSNPGVFISQSPSYTVKPGERYQFKVLGYRETAQNAKLYVKHASGDIVWSTGALLPQGLGNETWSTNEFVVPAGVTQITVGVRWDNPTNNAVNGATMYINQVALFKMDWEYQYFLKDHVGSPRVVLSTNPSTQKYTATFELKNESTENDQFFNIKRPTNTTVHPSNVTPGGSEVVWLDKNYRVGPSRSIRVYPGDQIDASVSAFYATMSGLSPAATTAISSELINVITAAGLTTFDGGITQAYDISSGSGLFTLSPDNGTSKPSAFLNYILFDENYQPLEAKSVSVGNANTIHMLSFSAAFGNAIAIKEVGYIFIYLSYDNENSTPVYFDDFKITHTESPMVQVNDYYPFGLTAYSWIREGEYENRFLYQGKELDQKTGWQDFHARQYDAAIGRWFNNDPKGSIMPYTSNYASMMNNPVMYTDPDGQCPICIAAVVGAVVGGVVSGSAAWVNNQNVGEAVWKGGLVGAVGGALATVGGGSFLAQVAWGAAEGAVTGGLNAALWQQDILSGMGKGAISGAGFATLVAGVQGVRNAIDGYGFGTNVGISDKLVDDAVTDYVGTVDPVKAQRALDFVQSRWGMRDINMTYVSDLRSYGENYSLGSSLQINIGPDAFTNNSGGLLRVTITHEYAHAKLDWMTNKYGSYVMTEEAKASRAKWNYFDATSGYYNELYNAGAVQAKFSDLKFISYKRYRPGAMSNPVMFRNRGEVGFVPHKWRYLIPKRFSRLNLINTY